jgi:hypothetical protein
MGVMAILRCIFCGALTPYVEDHPLVVCDHCDDGSGW